MSYYTTYNTICQAKNLIEGEGSSLFNLKKVDHSLLGGFLGCEPSLSFFSGSGPLDTYLDTYNISRQKIEENKSGGESNTPQKPDKSGSSTAEKGVFTPVIKKFSYKEYKAKRSSCGKKFVRLKCKKCGMEYVARIGCNLRTCPVCARKQADKLFFDIMKIVRNLNITPVYKLRLITLTYGVEGDLRDRLFDCKKAFGKLWHNLLEKKGVGALLAYEVGLKNGSLHSHTLYYGPYIPYEKLKEEWRRVTGGKWVVNIQLCRGSKGVREVTKYLVKGLGDDIDLYTLYEVEKAFRNTRRIMTYGIFYDRVKEKYLFTCPVCGCDEWFFMEIVDKDLNEGFIRDTQYRWRVFEREKEEKSCKMATIL